MKRLVLCGMFVLAAATAGAAENCYVSEDDPTWSVQPVKDGFLWNQGVTQIKLYDAAAGTDVPRRVAMTEQGDAYPYLFHKGDLIFDNGVYAVADASKCQ